jgi:Mn2+/Fe2+ NRAMP family transporter
MIISNDRKIMGDRVKGLLLNELGWSAAAAMFIAAIVLVWTWTQ